MAMAHTGLLLVAFNLLVVSHGQVALPELPQWSARDNNTSHNFLEPSARRLAKFVEGQSFDTFDCSGPVKTYDKAALGCSITYTKKYGEMMGDLPDGLSLKFSCDGDSFTRAFHLNEDCAGSPALEQRHKVGECEDDPTNVASGVNSEKTISCSTEINSLVVKYYADASCSSSKLLIRAETWSSEPGQCALDADGTYFKGSCNEDGKTISQKRYSDSECTKFIRDDLTAYGPGDCIPFPDPSNAAMGSTFMRVEGDLPCGLTYNPESTSGSVHMAAFSVGAWLVAASAMLFQ